MKNGMPLRNEGWYTLIADEQRDKSHRLPRLPIYLYPAMLGSQMTLSMKSNRPPPQYSSGKFKLIGVIYSMVKYFSGLINAQISKSCPRGAKWDLVNQHSILSSR